MPREVLYHGGTAHPEGSRLTMRECDVPPFEEQGVVSRVLDRLIDEPLRD